MGAVWLAINKLRENWLMEDENERILWQRFSNSRQTQNAREFTKVKVNYFHDVNLKKKFDFSWN